MQGTTVLISPQSLDSTLSLLFLSPFLDSLSVSERLQNLWGLQFFSVNLMMSWKRQFGHCYWDTVLDGLSTDSGCHSYVINLKILLLILLLFWNISSRSSFRNDTQCRNRLSVLAFLRTPFFCFCVWMTTEIGIEFLDYYVFFPIGIYKCYSRIYWCLKKMNV